MNFYPLLLSSLLFFTPVSSSTPVIDKVSTTSIIRATSTIPELVHKYANEYNVSEERMLKTIECESGFNPNAIGDNNTSFGLSQIHLPAHPLITKSQALDPEFAIKFMAKNFSENNPQIWTCWRMFYQVDT